MFAGSALQQGFAFDAVQLEDAEDGFFDEVVGAGGSGGDADGDGGSGEPVFGEDFLFRLQVEVADVLARAQAAGVADEVGGEDFFAEFGEVGGVGGVVAADDEEEVHGFGEHGGEGVLALLGGSADGVEEAEVFLGALGAVAVGDGFFDAALDFFGFAAEHGGLVGDADALEVEVGVEVFAGGTAEALEEGGFIAAVSDVVADDVSFFEGEDDEVVSPARADGTAGGGFGFFVLGFAVDNGGDVASGVLADAFPDAHDVAAGGVHNLAAAFLDAGKGSDIGAEGGDDDDVADSEDVEVGGANFANEVADAEGADLLVDLGVVDDFAEDVEAFALEDFGGGVSEVDGALDAVAEAELFGEFDGDSGGGEGASAGAEAVHDFAAVVGFDLGHHLGHHLRCSQVDPFGGGGVR